MSKELRIVARRVEVSAPDFWGLNNERRNLGEFIEHAKNHRDLDGYNLRLVEETQEICSHCEHEWEVADQRCVDEFGDELGEPLCCNAAQEEWKASRVPPPPDPRLA